MIKVDSVIIVEGKYDKITLENIVDATIVTTNGFGIYKDQKKQELIKILCNKKGVVIVTDSDSAGAQIRSYIKGFCETDKIINVFLPQIPGKEKRKSKASKQGYLGLEGLDEKTIVSAFEKSGVFCEKFVIKDKITNLDLYKFGLSGSENSKLKRESFCEFVSIPSGLSSHAFLDAINAIFSKEEFLSEVRLWHQAQVKN